MRCSVGGAEPQRSTLKVLRETRSTRGATRGLDGETDVRIWSLHPSYLDARGLVALWREALLARAVLRGQTRGYTRHPQLERFRRHSSPPCAIDHYLVAILEEARGRGYDFDARKIGRVGDRSRLIVTTGQLDFELAHLRSKIAARAPSELARLPERSLLRPHPLFDLSEGPVADWERGMRVAI